MIGVCLCLLWLNKRLNMRLSLVSRVLCEKEIKPSNAHHTPANILQSKWEKRDFYDGVEVFFSSISVRWPFIYNVIITIECAMWIFLLNSNANEQISSNIEYGLVNSCAQCTWEWFRRTLTQHNTHTHLHTPWYTLHCTNIPVNKKIACGNNFRLLSSRFLSIPIRSVIVNRTHSTRRLNYRNSILVIPNRLSPLFRQQHI